MLLETTQPQELYTTATLFTQAAMTTVAWLLPAVLVGVFQSLKPFAKFMSLVIALVLAFIAAFLVDGKVVFVPDALKILVAIVNGFVVAAAALGINQAGARASGSTLAQGGGFWADWL
jgi:hypothetical protein